MDIAWAWVQFGICVALIWTAGVRLLRYGDIIAERTGASRTWIGVILLASVTSLPELVTGISSVTLADAPDIAAGDVLGSCVFNLAALIVLDFFARGESVYSRAARGHVLSAGYGVVLLGLAALVMFLASHGVSPAIGHVGVGSLVLGAVYVLALRSVFHYEREAVQEMTKEVRFPGPAVTLRRAVARYAMWALLVVAAALWLPFAAEAIAAGMSWRASFVGNIVVSAATSAPEVVVTVAAARSGALNMAIGNLLGSNLFNIAILAVDDLLYAPGPLFSAIDPMQAATAVIGAVMTGAAVAGLLQPPRKRVFGTVGVTSVALLALYLLNVFLLAGGIR